jgi:hypothetical protein
MLEVFNSGDHNFSPNVAHSPATEARERGERRTSPESAEGLSGPVDRES